MIWLRTLLPVLIPLVAAYAMGPTQALAQKGSPAILYDIGGRFDASFNQAAWDGVKKYMKESGDTVREFEIQNQAEREQGLRNLARRGASIVVAVGFNNATPVSVVAKEFPNTKFTIIDAVVDLPNVQSVLFRSEEGSFLVGMVAALASKTGKIGFVGGMDIPLIRTFLGGYAAGGKFANPKVELFSAMNGTTAEAFHDPVHGGELARDQIARGADVIFSCAGATNFGVFQAAKDAGKLAIGVDSNQNGLQPGTVVTSMVKHVDVAVYKAMTAVKAGTWTPGAQTLGLKEDGVDWAYDEFNKPLITPAILDAVTKARADIIAGKIKVADGK
jgi:basic membrane protein A